MPTTNMPNIEQTLVLVKPDGVERGLIGEILKRFETVGLKVVALKMVKPTRDQADRHYALTEEWMSAVYEKAKAKYEALGQAFPFPDHVAYGTSIKNSLVDFLVSAPVVALVLEGVQSVALVRKIVGATEPASSAPGTIRGDLSYDTYALSNEQDRPLRNLIHASGTVDEANNERSIWFTPAELYEVNSILEPILTGKDRFRVK